MKKIFILLAIITSTLFAEAIENINLIKSNYRDYYFGEGLSYNPTEANDYAINDLITQISVNVSSDFTRIVNNQDLNQVELIVKQQANASLQNVNTISYIQKDEQYHIFKYMKKSEVEKIFEARKELVFDIFNQANTSINRGDIGTALKLLYYSNILMNSLPGERIEYAGVNFTSEIPFLINDILNNIEFIFTDSTDLLGNSKEITVKARYKGQEITNLEYFYWDGMSNKKMRLRDGFSIITLLSSEQKLSSLRVFVEYEYAENRNEIRSVSDLWNSVERPRYDNRKTINFSKRAKKKVEEEGFQVSTSSTGEIKNEMKINEEILKLMEAIKNNKFSYSDKFLNDKLSNLSKYVKMAPIANKTEGQISKTFEGYEYRPLYVKTSYNSINLESIEALVLDFDETGNLIDINFSMNKELYNSFVQAGDSQNDWKERQVVAKFLEKYRTCFLARDIKTLAEIFSDDAVIIVGHIKKADNSSNYEFIEEDKFLQSRYTKEEYLRNTKRMFGNREDIFLNFHSIRLDKRNDLKGVYGLSMRQNFNSTTYSDEGHLFLLVDFNNKLPQIHIRSWQPEEWNEMLIHNLANFTLFK